MDFSDSYATGIQSIIVPNGSDIASPDDLAGKKIGTQRGTTGYIYCSDDFGDDAVVAYDSGLTAVQALNNGQVDAVVIDNDPCQGICGRQPRPEGAGHQLRRGGLRHRPGQGLCPWRMPSTLLWRS